MSLARLAALAVRGAQPVVARGAALTPAPDLLTVLDAAMPLPAERTQGARRAAVPVAARRAVGDVGVQPVTASTAPARGSTIAIPRSVEQPGTSVLPQPFAEAVTAALPLASPRQTAQPAPAPAGTTPDSTPDDVPPAAPVASPLALQSATVTETVAPSAGVHVPSPAAASHVVQDVTSHLPGSGVAPASIRPASAPPLPRPVVAEPEAAQPSEIHIGRIEVVMAPPPAARAPARSAPPAPDRGFARYAAMRAARDRGW